MPDAQCPPLKSAIRNPQSEIPNRPPFGIRHLAFGIPSRPGFTLLEVILSIAIIMLLLGGIFGFYQFTLKVRARTQASATEAQLARVLLDQMARDLRSTSAVTAFIRQRTVQRGFVIRGAGDNTTPEGGLIGTEDSVAFLSSHFIPPSRFVETTVLDEEGPREDRPPLYDVFQVSWSWLFDDETQTSFGLYRTSRPALLQRMSEEEAASVDLLGNDETGPSLWERELAERKGVPLESEDPTGADPGDPMQTVDRIAPEVKWMYIRYYDGARWQTSYQDGASGPSPLAVEITIGFAPLLSAEEMEAGKLVKDRLAELFGEDNESPLPARTYQRTVYLSSGEMFSGGGVRNQRRN